MIEFNLDNILRNNVKKLIPYSSARSEFEGDAQIFLDANENSLGSVLNRNFHRYPDPLQKQLKQKLGAIKNVPSENIFVGNGSDEAIDLLIRAFCNPGVDNILIFPPTYGMYEVAAEINDVAINKVLLTKNYQLDVDAIKNGIDKNTKIIFVCSPNNPTGNLLDTKSIEWLPENFNGIVVVDEAYIDFAGTESWIKKLDQYPNLVVLQTLSKAWGLAGLRIGFAYASKEIIHVFNKIKPPYNISEATQQLALRALQNEAQAKEKTNVLIQQKERLLEDFKQFDFINTIHPSDANFILVKVDNAKDLYQYLVSKTIVVRNRSSQPLCENSLRITVGTLEENDALLTALKHYNQ
ncbi:MAG TPA: histidinol-phosphate transaminase [Parafilimonas sp.]|nr:histidinol-phosphate transaminase [Parafilimonas sp.]